MIKEKKLTQEEVWDEIAPLWNKYKINGFGTKDSILEEFISKDDKKVLDLGCGSGRNFISLKEAGFNGELYGVDFSQEMLKYAEENAKKFNIGFTGEKSKVGKLSFKDNFFDKVICIATLHCVELSEERKSAISEMYRVLKPKGKLLITVWNKNTKRWKNKPKEKHVSWKVEEGKVWRYYYLYDQEELIEDLEKTGFKILKANNPIARNIVLIAEK
ncbi:MAG: methyltransferase domain-containing protein [Candidatus Pacearchaeota archaeon]